MKFLISILVFICVLNVGAEETKPLFERLGGKKAVVSVIKETVANIDNDKEIRPFFALTFNTKKRKLRFMKLLYLQICEATGGGCKYSGKDMKTAHANMKIEKKHFQGLVNALVAALDKFKVPQKEKDELLAALGPMEADIVESDTQPELK